MNKRFVALALMALLVGPLLLIVPTLASKSSTPAIQWWTIDSGGGSSSGASAGARESATSGYSLRGSIGQPDAGMLSGSSYWLIGGYWGVETGTIKFRLCLPVVMQEP